MDYYELWFNLKDSSKDIPFARNLQRFMDFLEDKELILGHRLTRRKLGFGPSTLGEFHLVMEVRDLAQLERAFQQVATRGPESEPSHRGVWEMVCDFQAGLSRDFPDPVRVGWNEEDT